MLNTSYTACTTPSAPFYHADLAVLAAIESIGGDMPCAASAAITALALSLLILTALIATYFAYRAFFFPAPIAIRRKRR